MTEGSEAAGQCTISSSTSPTLNNSPSCLFYNAIPPSDIVGDMAGMANLEVA